MCSLGGLFFRALIGPSGNWCRMTCADEIGSNMLGGVLLCALWVGETVADNRCKKTNVNRFFVCHAVL